MFFSSHYAEIVDLKRRIDFVNRAFRLFAQAVHGGVVQHEGVDMYRQRDARFLHGLFDLVRKRGTDIRKIGERSGLFRQSISFQKLQQPAAQRQGKILFRQDPSAVLTAEQQPEGSVRKAARLAYTSLGMWKAPTIFL